MRATRSARGGARLLRACLTSARHAPGRRAAVVAATLAAVAGCVPASRYHEPRATPVAPGDAPGVEATAASLAGDWVGQYDGPLYGRRGALQLSLRRVAGGARGTGGSTRSTVSTVAGTATLGHGSMPARMAVDSARVGRGRVVLFLAPVADRESGATVQVRLDGALAADTLGGRLYADGAATAAAEHRGGWRLVRVVRTSGAAP